MSITIPAREVRNGDIIDFGGQPFTVGSVIPESRIDGTSLVGGYLCDNQHFDDLRVPSDALFNVQRPDPDAELVERVAGIYISTDGIRAVLARIRETHDITPRAES